MPHCHLADVSCQQARFNWLGTCKAPGQPKKNDALNNASFSWRMMQWQLTILFSYYCWIWEEPFIFRKGSWFCVYVTLLHRNRLTCWSSWSSMGTKLLVLHFQRFCCLPKERKNQRLLMTRLAAERMKFYSRGGSIGTCLHAQHTKRERWPWGMGQQNATLFSATW